MDFESFIRQRIGELRLHSSMTEYQLSNELGRGNGYINSISRGKMLPSMKELLAICSYFEITPMAFFDTEQDEPALVREIKDNLRSLEQEDLQAVLHIIERMDRRGHEKSEG